MAPSVIDVEGHAIAPEIVHHSLLYIGQATMNHILQHHPNQAPHIRQPCDPSGCVPRKGIRYKS